MYHLFSEFSIWWYKWKIPNIKPPEWEHDDQKGHNVPQEVETG